MRVKKKLVKAFTLIELLVTMSVMAILLSVGVPSFVEVVQNGRISSAVNCLNGALYKARSEAVKRSANVTVCPYETDVTCGTNWNNGALVFSEGAAAASTADLDEAEVDTGSTVLRVCPALHEDLTIVAAASSDRTVDTVNARSFIRYSREGSANWQLGYFAVCDERSSDKWKGINVGLSGDLRIARLHSDDDAIVDAFNRKIDSC